MILEAPTPFFSLHLAQGSVPLCIHIGKKETKNLWHASYHPLRFVPHKKRGGKYTHRKCVIREVL
ncbi:MAG: hypothetical protein AB1657_05700 [Candidatus Micrarchaeota archaeon]